MYTVLYPFMASVLNLAGLAKECFAVIFGFWIAQGERPISASIIIMQAITGGSRPAIIKAIRFLKEQGMIQAEKVPGKRTMYIISIDPKIIGEFKETYPSALVKRTNPHELTPDNSTGKVSTSQNKSNPKRETSYNTPLRVRMAGEINKGGLKEV